MFGMPERTRVCVKKRGELSNNKTMNQSLFVFFWAINFRTPCTYRVSQKSQTNLKLVYFGLYWGHIERRMGYQVKAYSKIFCLSENPPLGVTVLGSARAFS